MPTWQNRLRSARAKCVDLASPFLSPLRSCLANAQFARYAGASFLAYVGAWMQRFALGWVIWNRSHSGADLALLTLADLIPALVLSPLGGALGDRIEPRKLIVATQGIACLAQLATAVGIFLDISTAAIVAMAVVSGCISSLGDPVKYAVVRGLVPPEQLPTGLALSSISYNFGRFLGPVLAGLALAIVSPAATVAMAAALFFPLLWTAMRLDIPQKAAISATTPGIYADIVTGIVYVFSQRAIVFQLVLCFLCSLLIRPAYDLIPALAKEAFGGSLTDVTLITSAFGIGAFLANFNLARLVHIDQIEKKTITGGVGAAASLAILCLAPTVILAIAPAFVLGFCVSTNFNAATIASQMRVDHRFQSRLSSVVAMTVRAAPALGALAVGFTGDLYGFRYVFMAGAALFVILALQVQRLRRRRLAQ